jgi:protocatechuate 3,4-dioxygenase beta subunit
MRPKSDFQGAMTVKTKGSISTSFLVTVLLASAGLGFALWMLWGAEPTPLTPGTTNSQPTPEVSIQRETPPPIKPRPPQADQGAPIAVGAQGNPTEIAGFVRDAEGNALADATIQIIDYKYNNDPSRRLIERFDVNVLASTASDSEGRYAFSGLVPGGRHYMKATAPNFITQYKDHVAVGLLADFNLKPGVRVKGLVHDAATGQPVANAVVKGWFRTPNVSDVNRLFRWEEKVRSNEAGEFIIEGAPIEMVKFIVVHEDYEDFMEDVRLTAGAVNTPDLKVKRGLVVRGKVVDKMSGEAVAGAKVTFASALVPRLEVQTNAEGVFDLRGVERTPQIIAITAGAYTDHRETRTFAESDSFNPAANNQVVFRLDPAAMVNGRVVSAEGVPVDNARIYAALKNPMTKVVRGLGEAEAVTDGQGRFTVRNLNANATYALAVLKDGAALTVSPDFTLGPKETRDNFEIQLSAGASISGSVLDEVGTPVAGAVLTVEVPPLSSIWFPPSHGVGGGRSETIVTGADGHYRLEGLWTGTFTIGVTHPEHVELAQQKVQLDTAGQTLVKDFTLRVGRYISGTVLLADGKPAVGATVSAALPFTDKPAGSTKAGEDGRFRLAGLIKGNYRVQARADGMTSRGVENVPSDTDGVNFTLEEFGGVIGTVLSPEGAPVLGFSAELVPLDVALENQLALGSFGTAGDAEQDVGGRFHIRNVDPGRYKLIVRSNEFARVQIESLQVTSGMPTDVGTISMNRGARLHGRVTDIRKAPAQDASIELYNNTLAVSSRPNLQKPKEGIQGTFDPTKLPGSEQVRWRARVNSEGDYSVAGLPPGEYTVVVESESLVPPEKETVTISENSDITRDYRLAPNCKGIITVNDNFNMPVPAVLASVVDAATGKRAGKAGMSPRTDAKGEVLLEGIAPGKYIVTLYRGGYMRIETTIDLMETQVVRSTVVLQKIN